MLIGLLGKPSCGKSTFFQAATGMPVERASYPFTTIKPNHGVGYVRIECVDKELGVKCNPRSGYCIDSNRFIGVEMMDVAGLVPGAHEGKGLGNQFLDDLRQADILIHVLDASGSANEKGEKITPGSYDPANDVRFLEDELNYWIKGILEKNLKKLTREQNVKKLEEVLFDQFTGLGISKDAVIKTLKELKLEEKRLETWTEEERYSFCKKMRYIGKPIIIAANKADLPHAKENIEKIKKEFPEYIIVPCSAEAELSLKEAAKKGFVSYIPGNKEFKKLKELNPQQEKAMEFLSKFIKDYDQGTGVQDVLNTAVFKLLGYIAVFPGGIHKLEDSQGRVLPDVFLLPPDSNAKDFAATIHTDLAENFVKAIDVKTKKPMGADHKLNHRDVIEIMFSK